METQVMPKVNIYGRQLSVSLTPDSSLLTAAPPPPNKKCARDLNPNDEMNASGSGRGRQYSSTQIAFRETAPVQVCLCILHQGIT